MIKYVYIAAPYTYGDVVVNVRRACEAAEHLRSWRLVPFVPHLSHLWHMITPHEIAYWYDYDLEWLEKCDTLLRLPGISMGADAEVKFAKALGKRCYGSMDALLADFVTERNSLTQPVKE
jgi:hypothetical protein